jgi:hypothetical protein
MASAITMRSNHEGSAATIVSGAGVPKRGVESFDTRYAMMAVPLIQL